MANEHLPLEAQDRIEGLKSYIAELEQTKYRLIYDLETARITIVELQKMVDHHRTNLERVNAAHLLSITSLRADPAEDPK